MSQRSKSIRETVQASPRRHLRYRAASRCSLVQLATARERVSGKLSQTYGTGVEETRDTDVEVSRQESKHTHNNEHKCPREQSVTAATYNANREITRAIFKVLALCSGGQCSIRREGGKAETTPRSRATDGPSCQTLRTLTMATIMITKNVVFVFLFFKIVYLLGPKLQGNWQRNKSWGSW